MNSLRVIYLDGRSHTDPDIVVRSFNGESIGNWEGDTLVVDTKYFPGHHHWLDQGGASVPASEDLHIVERFRMQKDSSLDIEYTMTDPKNWEGEWKMTKTFRRRDDTDITEVQCLPDLNDRLPATKPVTLACLALLVTAAGGSLIAHHSPVMFDRSVRKTLVGKVVEFAWTNPHSSIQLDVPGPDGGVERVDHPGRRAHARRSRYGLTLAGI
jgi:hypothetical protein